MRLRTWASGHRRKARFREYKLPWALRRHRLIERLGAIDAGTVVPPRYLSQWIPGTVRNEQAIAGYSLSLAERLTELRKDCVFPLVLGGDCSILLGNMLALGREGRFVVTTPEDAGHASSLTYVNGAEPRFYSLWQTRPVAPTNRRI